MKEYKICNLHVQSEGGSIGDYKFKRVDDYAEKIKLLYKPEIIKEKFKIIFISNKERISEQSNDHPDIVYEPMRYGSHQVTAIATIDEDKEKTSVFSDTKTSIYDILLLYNFLTGQNACLETDIEEFSHLNKIGITLGEESSFTTAYIISTGLKELTKTEWRNKNKDVEILSFLFFLDARDNKKLQISFLEIFTALEILEPSEQFDGKIFDIYNVPNFISKFVKGDFKEIISVIRNCYIHSGECSFGKFKDEIVARNQATQQLRNFVNSLSNDVFFRFKADTWDVMDYLLCRTFSQILGIDDKVGNFNAYWYKLTKKYFKEIYG